MIFQVVLATQLFCWTGQIFGHYVFEVNHFSITEKHDM